MTIAQTNILINEEHRNTKGFGLFLSFFLKRLRFLKMFVILGPGIKNTLKTIQINKERAFHNGKTSSNHLHGCS